MGDAIVIAKVNTILEKMDAFFHGIEPSLKNGMSRDKYFMDHKIANQKDFNFALTAYDIIKNKIPYNVAGCTGRAKLFSYFADEIGADATNYFYHWIIPTAKIDDIINGAEQINGHQLVGVVLSDGLHLIDPGIGKSFQECEIKNVCRIGEEIDSTGAGIKDHIITDIMMPERFDNVDTYKKMESVYLRNTEIQNAFQTIGLINKYLAFPDSDALIKLKHVNNEAYELIRQRDYPAKDLVENIKKAISLDRYRPKNMSITELAVSSDLNNIGGEFSTFDIDLSKMSKEPKNYSEIRERFKYGMVNLALLSKQFAKDWVRRLNNHKYLVNKARNANDENAINAYDDLFKALAKDFCDEYDCAVNVKVVDDWKKSEYGPKKGENKTFGYQIILPALDVKCDSESEANKIYKEFMKNPYDYPGSYLKSIVRVNITNIRKAHPEKDDFFYFMIGCFVHEIHHGLDGLKPHENAVGSQYYFLDTKTHIDAADNLDEYIKSATEISSYTIEKEFKKLFKKSRS